LVALEESPAKLSIDHQNARLLAEGLARVPGVRVDPGGVATNIVIFDVSETGVAAAEVSTQLKRRGVLMNAINERCLRAVTHYDVDRTQCGVAVDAVAETVAAGMAAGKPS
jgi:threonine aldolase